MPNRKRFRSANDGQGSPRWPSSEDPFGRDVRLFQSGAHSLEYMVCGEPELRPIVILQSLEYPGWPPVGFCELAASAGFRIVTVRRPGFGANPPLADMDDQASLVAHFLDAEDIRGAIVVSKGTANPIGHRLAVSGHPRIALSVFANCGFNYDQLAEFQPDWFARTLEQALTKPAGARLSLMSLKSSWGIFGSTWVHENMWSKSSGDLAFLRNNPELVREAIGMMQARLDVPTFMAELAASLIRDPFLVDGLFRDVPAITVSGLETNASWKQGVDSEAERLGLPPAAYLSAGDTQVIYQSAVEFFECLIPHI